MSADLHLVKREFNKLLAQSVAFNSLQDVNGNALAWRFYSVQVDGSTPLENRLHQIFLDQIDEGIITDPRCILYSDGNSWQSLEYMLLQNADRLGRPDDWPPIQNPYVAFPEHGLQLVDLM